MELKNLEMQHTELSVEYGVAIQTAETLKAERLALSTMLVLLRETERVYKENDMETVRDKKEIRVYTYADNFDLVDGSFLVSNYVVADGSQAGGTVFVTKRDEVESEVMNKKKCTLLKEMCNRVGISFECFTEMREISDHCDESIRKVLCCDMEFGVPAELLEESENLDVDSPIIKVLNESRLIPRVISREFAG
ncbi:MAG: hypothetical protein LBN07_03950 [Christensenellaceae bacterium]|jgi:hypothetical protein|nr:hypothetical protein [Christensenellaceae bacterium]